MKALSRSVSACKQCDDDDDDADDADDDALVSVESGQIEFGEFCDLLAQRMEGDDKEESLRAAFRTFDQDGSGKISAQELRDVISKRLFAFSDPRGFLDNVVLLSPDLPPGLICHRLYVHRRQHWDSSGIN